MVLEHAEERSFSDWLLGSGWEQGALFRWLPLMVVVAAVVAVVLICRQIAASRERPLTGTKATDWLVLTALALLVSLPGLLLAGWLFYPGWPGFGWGFLAWLLGMSWYQGAAYLWLLMVVGLSIAGFLGRWLFLALRYGPIRGLKRVCRELVNGTADLARVSPRRILALGWLAVRESLRRRVVVVFAVFVVLLLFAGWFLDPGSSQPARLYLSFVLTATTYLMLLLALFLSSLSLPDDIKRKTIYTVVTKPVHSCEIVLGRICGFAAVGTILLAIMGSISYVFVVRGLSHTHELTEADLHAVKKTGDAASPREGHTSKVRHHWHPVTADAEGHVQVGTEQGHWHGVTARKSGADKQFSLEMRFAKELNAKEASPELLDAFDGQGVELDPNSTEIKVLESAKRWEIADSHSGQVFTIRLTDPEPGQSPELLATKCVETIYTLGPPQGMLVARVPIYGSIRFKSRDGKDVRKGINVGDEWGYRSFIEGGTLATAIWTFEGVTEDKFPEEQFPQGIPMEMTIEVFRTYKGDTEDPENIPGIPGSLSVRNPETDERVEARIFTAQDFVTDVQYIPRTLEVHNADEAKESREKIFHKLDKDESGDLTAEEFAGKRKAGKDRIAQRFGMIDKDGNGMLSLDEFTDPSRKIDLFEDIVVDGKLEVWLRCLHPAQYFGAAEPDVYLRARDKAFTLNFVKGYAGIWLQMVVIITIGVMFSTFLSGPVATIATMGALVGGMFSRYMAGLGASQFMDKATIKNLGLEYVYGGGPFEALIRLLTQQNVVSEMERSLRTDVAQMVDGVLGYALYVTAHVLPQFYRFDFANFVANGFDISGPAMCKCLCRALAYMIPVFVAAFLFLKKRELA